jgi:hypothetical protein
MHALESGRTKLSMDAAIFFALAFLPPPLVLRGWVGVGVFCGLAKNMATPLGMSQDKSVVDHALIRDKLAAECLGTCKTLHTL